MVIYELHTGTFTPQGTFEAIIPRLPELRKMGITTLNLMPVAQFAGDRNWGYDGVYPFAVQSSYGEPFGLKNLVNACHALDMDVLLDVVYNHLGPEGNYLNDFGPYFTDTYQTPWGPALNFDGPSSDHVRNFFLENVLHWVTNYHIDGFRLDAVHGIFDMSAEPFLRELSILLDQTSQWQGKTIYLISESDLNDVKILRPLTLGGFGHHAQWTDDFHHCLHTLLTGEATGYYEDFGRVSDLATSLQQGFVYSGQYSMFRHKHFGTSSKDQPGWQHIVYAQNHDQVGNRGQGERLSSLVPFEALKLAAGAVFVSPFVPLLFMGEEYGEQAPFLYFIDHSDPNLVEAVREGRKREFQSFDWQDFIPDPKAEDTFLRSKINWSLRSKDRHGLLLKYYKELISLRLKTPALRILSKACSHVHVQETEKTLCLQRWAHDSHIMALMNFHTHQSTCCPDSLCGQWQKLLDSSAREWQGPGSIAPQTVSSGQSCRLQPQSICVYSKQKRKSP
jgi:maltooligosyltrehalose trehalohydrolase